MKKIFLMIAVLMTSAVGFSSALECYDSARGYLPQTRAMNLCAGAVDVSPVRCFVSAKNNYATENQALDLCTGALSETAPVACFLFARDHTYLGKQKSLQLCQFAKNEGPSQCFEKARKILSENLALELCTQAASAEPVACFKVAEATYLSRNQAITLCQARRQH